MIGTKLAHYEITAHLGSGGMGDVYQATDLKLRRSVAIKLLPAEFSSDAERLSRFRREAQLLASLNHPNIAHIYGIEESGDKRCIVMELVEGETLQARLKRGPIPVDEALQIAKQICEALEAAHEKGVIHRDLKPGNVMLTGDGKVKVLDFGLAKAMESDTSNANLSNSPTMMSGASMPGVILGTASYMSPEQARGRKIDKRTDIFAFGCVLYEMLTGKRAFDGEDVTDILSGVLRAEPDWTKLPLNAPSTLHNLLRLCMEKNANNRFSDAADVRLWVGVASKELTEGSTAKVAVSNRSNWPIIATTATAVIAAVAIFISLRSSGSDPEMRVDIDTPHSDAPFEFALSPDGRSIVFVASGDESQRLWLRTFDKAEAQPIAGTDGADYPFWSPDGRSLGFFAKQKLYRVDVGGGPPQALAPAAVSRGGTWSADGVILFSPSPTSGLMRVPASGGAVEEVTHLQKTGRDSDKFPRFLPDGRHFLFYAQGTAEASGIYLGTLDRSEPKLLLAGIGNSFAEFMTPDTLVFARQGVLMAQHIDTKRWTLPGDMVKLADSIGRSGIGGFGGFSVSRSGRIAFRKANSNFSQLVWIDRQGNVTPVPGAPVSNEIHVPELSADGSRIALNKNDPSKGDVWLMDLLRGGAMTRFTFDPASTNDPIWSPDGTRVAFASNRKGSWDFYVGPVNHPGAEVLLFDAPGLKYPRDWSKNGRYLLFSQTDAKSGEDLWAFPMMAAAGEKKPFPVASSPFDERNGQFSPDGHWVAYETNESGRFEIVMQPFPEASEKRQVSVNGGTQPRWSVDGKEIFFVSPDNQMMATPVRISGSTFESQTPIALFAVRVPPNGINKQEYAVSRDGRFLVNELVEEAAATPITLILNSHPKAEK